MSDFFNKRVEEPSSLAASAVISKLMPTSWITGGSLTGWTRFLDYDRGYLPAVAAMDRSNNGEIDET
jgi:hypothetical protein